MRWSIFLVALVIVFAGCTNDDDCMVGGTKYRGPGYPIFSSAKANKALEQRADKEYKKNGGVGIAVELECTHSANPTTKRPITITFKEVWQCVHQAIPNAAANGMILDVVQCIDIIARIANAKIELGWPDGAKTPDQLEELDEAMIASKCVEVKRNVEVPIGKDGLNKIGMEEWAPAVLFLIQIVDKFAPAVPAPAIFILKSNGDEEACVPDEPDRRCTDDDGCPERPEGATDVGNSAGSGGDTIPPGTDPPPPGDHT